MILWFTAGAVFVVWNVFQSPGLDFRLVALGSLLPLLVDAPFGHRTPTHSLLAAVAVLVVVMAATAGRGRRLLRRRMLGLPIGWFCGLVLSGSWADKELFWWPAFGIHVPHTDLLPGVGVVLAEEVLGLLAVVWAWRRFGLADAARRRLLCRSGRVEVVG